MTKTSPSAGSLHPIECYVLAWNVEGLAPGLYHFDVGAGDLRRLRRGRLRAQAVRAASGQAWVGRAAFLCIMTAVFGRSLWKYQDEVTYRTLFLDAGHLAQTFCLLAASRGLGPFTTAAIQDSYIETLLGLDGASEFPVYLCGAGPGEGERAALRRRRRLAASEVRDDRRGLSQRLGVVRRLVAAGHSPSATPVWGSSRSGFDQNTTRSQRRCASLHSSSFAMSVRNPVPAFPSRKVDETVA